MIGSRYLTSVRNTRPGADSDHTLVVADIRLRLKRVKKGKSKVRWQVKENPLDLERCAGTIEQLH